MSPEELFTTYMQSVGRGSTLLLNVPPDQRGQFHENDVASLLGMRKIIDSVFAENLAENVQISASNFRGESEDYAAANLIDGNADSFWVTDEGVIESSIELEFDSALESYQTLSQASLGILTQTRRNLRLHNQDLYRYCGIWRTTRKFFYPGASPCNLLKFDAFSESLDLYSPRRLFEAWLRSIQSPTAQLSEVQTPCLHKDVLYSLCCKEFQDYEEQYVNLSRIESHSHI